MTIHTRWSYAFDIYQLVNSKSTIINNNNNNIIMLMSKCIFVPLVRKRINGNNLWKVMEILAGDLSSCVGAR